MKSHVSPDLYKSIRKQVEKELEDAKIAALNVLEDLSIEKANLEMARAKEKAILLSVGDGLIATDEKGNITLINKTAEKLFGRNSKEIIGKSFFEVISIEDESGVSIPLEKQPVSMALVGGATTTTTTTTGPTYYYVRPDKTKFPLAITVTPIILDGKIIGTIEIFRDITKEKEIDKAKSEFVSLASHQLRTPLTGIQWVAERFSKKEKLSSEGKGYLDDIITATGRLASLIELLLNVTRIEEGNVGIVPRPIELVKLVNKFVQEFNPLCAKKALLLQFEKHPATLEVISDENVLRNIIQVIVSNAIEYTPKGGRIQVSLEKKESTFLFTISDTGIGIPKKDQPFVFKKLFRGSNANTIKTDGTGLGLYIAAEATKIFNGKIWFESPTIVETKADKEENKGATFYIELPLKAERKTGEKSFA